MNNNLLFPIEVIVQEVEHQPGKKALMFCIYPDDNGIPCATCWMIESEVWYTCSLSSVKPILDTVKKIKLNEYIK